MKLYLAGIQVESYQLDLGIECAPFADPRLEQTIQGMQRVTILSSWVILAAGNR